MRDSSIQIFAHIPKTAGSTLVQVMRRQFRPDEILSYEDRLWAVSVGNFLDRAATGLNGIQCVMGHIPFGVHQVIGVNVRYVTMLRDPVEWTLSMYSYIKARHRRLPYDEKFPQRVVFADVPQMSLDEFVEFCRDMGMANLQTRYVSGCLNLQHPLPPYEKLPPTALDTALANLVAEHTTFGIVEHFDLSLLLFKQRLGWKNVYYRSSNITEHRMAREQVSAATLARIGDLHGEDVRLYEIAVNAFWRALAEARLDHPFALYRFRAANMGYKLLKGVQEYTRRFVGRTLRALGLPRAGGEN